MRTRKGKITHLTIQDFITMKELPEPSLETANEIKRIAFETLCDDRPRAVYYLKGINERTGITVPLFPLPVLEDSYLMALDYEKEER